MLTTLKVGDFKCLDDSTGTRGLIMSVGPASYVTLIFDKSIPHKRTDDLRDMLASMKLVEVQVQLPGSSNETSKKWNWG